MAEARKQRSKAVSVSSDRTYENLQLAKHFAIAYAPFIVSLLLVPAWVVCRSTLYWASLHTWGSLHLFPLQIALVLSASMASATVLLAFIRSRPCYLVDFSCFKSLDEYKLTMESSEKITRSCGKFTYDNMVFQLKVALKSGIGDETYGCPNLFEGDMNPTMEAGRGEMDLMLFGAIDELLIKSDLDPAKIDFLIVHACLFYPTPSLSARIVNRYKLREDVRTYNLSGMGCAAGLAAVDMAKDLLRVHKDKYVLIAGTENLTLNYYYGNDKSMLVPNCLFRCGSSALLLSNQRKDRGRAKFQLVQSVRTTNASSNEAFHCIVHREDDEGIVGTALSAKLIDVAAQALTVSMTKLVPFNMPLIELVKTAVSLVQMTILRQDVKPYLPDFKKAFSHFCIHPGGKAVIDSVGKNLQLSDYDLEPSRMSLHRFGNTSASGLWYALAYCEAKQRVKKGEKVWQVALGSGFKCNSVVWRALRDVAPTRNYNPWMDCIDIYPVDVGQITRSQRYYDIVEESKRRNEAKLQEGNNVETKREHGSTTS